MPGTEVKVPEPEQKEALGGTEPQTPDRAATNARKRHNTTPASLSRHAVKCRICNHPDRHAIEFDFLNWRNPGDIVRAYHFRDLSTIYRHAHATGLFAKRRLNLRFALERIVERVNEVPVTANAVIRAARAVSRINDQGEWIDPPSRLIVEHVNAEEPRRSERRKLRKTEKIAKSRPVPTFDPILLDEPSDSGVGELPKIPGEAGRATPQELIPVFTPEFQRCSDERRRSIEADRAANAAKNAAFIEQLKAESEARQTGLRSGGFTPPASPSPGAAAAPTAPPPVPQPQDIFPPSMLARLKNLTRVGPDWTGTLIANEPHSRGESND